MTSHRLEELERRLTLAQARHEGLTTRQAATAQRARELDLAVLRHWYGPWPNETGTDPGSGGVFYLRDFVARTEIPNKEVADPYRLTRLATGSCLRKGSNLQYRQEVITGRYLWVYEFTYDGTNAPTLYLETLYTVNVGGSQSNGTGTDGTANYMVCYDADGAVTGTYNGTSRTGTFGPATWQAVPFHARWDFTGTIWETTVFREQSPVVTVGRT